VDLLESGPKLLSRRDVRAQEGRSAEYPLCNLGVSQVIKDMPAITTLNHEPVSAEDCKLLRNTGVSGAKRAGQPIYVDFAAAEFLDDTNAIGVGENSEEFGELLADECSPRHIVMYKYLHIYVGLSTF
jgi:hypothetical protein